jgi:Leucine-rich repeat (LRR) protein
MKLHEFPNGLLGLKLLRILDLSQNHLTTVPEVRISWQARAGVC